MSVDNFISSVCRALGSGKNFPPLSFKSYLFGKVILLRLIRLRGSLLNYYRPGNLHSITLARVKRFWKKLFTSVVRKIGFERLSWHYFIRANITDLYLVLWEVNWFWDMAQWKIKFFQFLVFSKYSVYLYLEKSNYI